MDKRIILILLIGLNFPLIADDIGDYYAAKEYYFEAITEYKRQLFFEEYEDVDALLYKIGAAYYAATKGEAAEDYLLEAIYNRYQSASDLQCLGLLAKIHWDHYDYEAMRATLAMIAARSDSTARDQLDYITAWTYIYQALWDQGMNTLNHVEFITTKTLMRDILAVQELPRKSKMLAQLLSNLIPGSGQLYAGDYQNALYSFALVGGVTASIVHNIIQKAYYVALVKYFFIYSRYSRGGLKNLAYKIDRDNVDRVGDYLKSVAQKYPQPITLLEEITGLH